MYEHFINREGKTMKDLGQYFTDRTLIKYLVDLINPKLKEMLFLSHSLCHAAHGFYSSNYDEALIVALDGIGRI